ncbi:hypothetical protein OG709_01565 [Streptomyces sp. NBC_01267]|uniref:hypothetical protein n=1 Tax=Streptomyces sp. NBC_01267 TaxID=2903805 RepID=UPI002E31E803|nr:hypothetical protein [Streptomyces sp. NBC_01267]
MPPGLDELRAERDAQRGCEGFGAFADRNVVHLRRDWDEEDDEPVVSMVPFSKRDPLRARGKSISENWQDHSYGMGPPASRTEQSTPGGRHAA